MPVCAPGVTTEIELLVGAAVLSPSSAQRVLSSGSLLEFPVSRSVSDCIFIAANKLFYERKKTYEKIHNPRVCSNYRMNN